MYKTGGGQPRGLDLLGIRYRNCATAQRGFYIDNGPIIYVNPSHKAKRSTIRSLLSPSFYPSKPGM